MTSVWAATGIDASRTRPHKAILAGNANTLIDLKVNGEPGGTFKFYAGIVEFLETRFALQAQIRAIFASAVLARTRVPKLVFVALWVAGEGFEIKGVVSGAVTITSLRFDVEKAAGLSARPVYLFKILKTLARVACKFKILVRTTGIHQKTTLGTQVVGIIAGWL